MKKILTFLFLTTFWANAQSPAGIWYFGDKAGLNFNLGPNPMPLLDSQIDTTEGCATLSDEFGNLLFYTDGVSVWNRNHQIMDNGTGLLGNPSSTQSAIIVPTPNDNSKYYVFTVDQLGQTNGLRYSIIDLNLDGGLGAITTKNILLFSPSLEKITSVRHSNGVNFWLISHRYNSNQFVVYEITPTGINTPITSNVGLTINNDTQRTIGYLKSSPDGQFIAIANANSNSAMQLFNFNNLTGQLNLTSTSVVGINNMGAYGLEFSSNSKLLYMSVIDYDDKKSKIYQFNIESQDETIINQSKTLVGEYDSSGTNDEGTLAALQLAPNQKIYIARNKLPLLAAINNPNIIGTGCNFELNAVDLEFNNCLYGLPAFISSYLDVSFIATNFCVGESTNFQLPDINDIVSVNWNFGDIMSSNNTTTILNPSHTYANIGIYQVTLVIQTSTSSRTFTKQVQIVPSPVPIVPTNFQLCSNSSTATFNLLEKNNEIYGSQSSENYIISYHLSVDDASDNSNKITTITNTSNPQTVFARMQSRSGNDCYQIVSFDLIVNPNPTLQPDDDIFYCLNSFPQTIAINAGNTNPSENLTYTWSTGATTESIQINEIGIYTVTATNQYNCTDSRTITVNSSEIAEFSFVLQGEIGNYNLIINPSGTGNYVYALDNSEGPYQVSATFLSVTPGDHTIYVKDSNGCGVASDVFSVIGYPKYFTPNNDGYNDYWNLSGSFLNIKKLHVFDRFGKLLYNLQPNDLGWDGNYKGEKVPASDYWFHAVLESGEQIKGHFSLKR
jgi:gliding motility-associated-like protein